MDFTQLLGEFLLEHGGHIAVIAAALGVINWWRSLNKGDNGDGTNSG